MRTMYGRLLAWMTCAFPGILAAEWSASATAPQGIASAHEKAAAQKEKPIFWDKGRLLEGNGGGAGRPEV
jgi:hypothetical protein